jgi:deoxyhypusine synthase
VGEFMSHCPAFAVNPQSSFGVIVLIIGSDSDTEKIVIDAFKDFQRLTDLQANVVQKAYAGT